MESEQIRCSVGYKLTSDEDTFCDEIERGADKGQATLCQALDIRQPSTQSDASFPGSIERQIALSKNRSVTIDDVNAGVVSVLYRVQYQQGLLRQNVSLVYEADDCYIQRWKNVPASLTLLAPWRCGE